MRNGAFAIFIGILILIDLALHVGLGYGSVAPDLITVAALLAARRLTGAKAALLGLAIGLLADSLALNSFGASAVALVVVCFIGARTRDLFEGNSLLFTAVYLFLGKWLHDLIWFVFASDARQGTPLDTLWTVAPLQALTAAIAGAVALMIFRAIAGERRLR